MFKRILVPLDGSKLGEQAIPHAEALARAFGAELVLFQAFVSFTLQAEASGKWKNGPRKPVLRT